MDAAAQPGRADNAGDGDGQTFMAIEDDQLDAPQSAANEIAEEG